MPQVPAALVAERAARLREAAEAAHRRHLDARIGRSLTVLSERGGSGRAEDFTRIRFAEPVEPGLIFRIVAGAHHGRALLSS